MITSIVSIIGVFIITTILVKLISYVILDMRRNKYIKNGNYLCVNAQIINKRIILNDSPDNDDIIPYFEYDVAYDINNQHHALNNVRCESDIAFTHNDETYLQFYVSRSAPDEPVFNTDFESILLSVLFGGLPLILADILCIQYILVNI